MTASWRAIEWIIVAVFALTGVLVLAGLVHQWFIKPDAVLPHQGKLLTAFLFEAIAAAFVMFRGAMGYRPQTRRCRTPADFERFITDFVSSASTVDIVTNRLSWVSASAAMQTFLKQLVAQHSRVRIVTAQPVQCAPALAAGGVQLHQLPEGSPPPEARFTLVNADRSGAERLAIALGTFPQHIVYVFDSHSGPHLIGLAKDAVRLALAASTER